MKLLILPLFLVMFAHAVSSQGETREFQSPLSGKIILSGSFGEPRSRHFHAGIDFKPQMGWGIDSVRSIAQGHVSRISVFPGGYGNAIYVDHPQGYTSVYAHLDRFAPEIQRFVESEMYKRKVYSIQLFPDSNQLPVIQGEFLGIMGNTGQSSGPHLHFEIREKGNQTPLNPFHFGIMPSDDHAPVVRGITVYELSPDEEVLSKQYFAVEKTEDGTYTPISGTIRVGALLVGMGVHTYDTMNGASNHNGIYGLEAFVDGVPSFSFRLDEIPFSESKYLHSHMDYEGKLEKKYISKCYKEKHNGLKIYQLDDAMGKIDLYEDIPRSVQIIISDFHGNKSRLNCTLKRTNTLNAHFQDDNRLRVIPDKNRYISVAGHQVLITAGTFTTPTRLSVLADSLWINLKQDIPVPVFNPIVIQTKIRQCDRRVVLASLNGSDEWLNHGGKCVNDTLYEGRVSSLDSFVFMIDTISPSIEILNLPGPNSDVLKVLIKDDLLPQKSADQTQFDVRIDGEWILCSYDLKTHTISAKIDLPKIAKSRQLSITAKDSRSNTSSTAVNFTY